MPLEPMYAPITPRALPSAQRDLVVQAANNAIAANMSSIETSYPGIDLITSFGGIGEDQLRPPAAIAFSLGVLVAAGAHSPTTTGRSTTELTAMTVRLVDSLASLHAGNGGSWGGVSAAGGIVPDSTSHEWQGALWVAFVAVGARAIWGQLSVAQQTRVTNMIVAEANRFLSYPVPYHRDISGRVLTSGDTKAEENAWQSWILWLAAGMLPSHANAAGWATKAVELCISATATPSTPTSRRRWNGATGWGLAAGSNIELNGTLFNHNILSPNYIASMAQLWIAGLTFAWQRAGLIPAATLINAPLLYRAMVDVTFTSPPQLSPGGTIYTPGSWALYYPGGDEGDASRMANYVGLDALAYVLRADSTASVGADTWLARHAQKQLDMQAASSSSRRSQWDLQNVTWALFGDWVLSQGVYGVTNVAPVSLVAT